jgi:enterobacterial common antigen flippase
MSSNPIRLQSTPTQSSPAPETVRPVVKHSYGQILKSSATIGGASAVNIAIGIVRTKAMALLLGPAGIGLLGLYMLIADLARAIAGVGVNSSGVRQVAEAAGSGDADRIARSAGALRAISLVLAILGAVLLAAFSSEISALTFGDERHAGAVALLSLAVCFSLIADGRSALIQGLRRISDLAKLGMSSAFFGTIVSVSIVYFLGRDGLAPALVAIAATTLVISWWYSRKAGIQSPPMTPRQLTQEARGLLKLGVAFMASGLFMLGAAYVVRMVVLRHSGLDAAGFYHAAWTLGGLYIGFILQAMGADFYPRLVAVIKDDAQGNRLVNEQAHISLLLAGPGVIATLTLAPLVLALFYSARFAEAVDVLRWICLGIALRVITWPMGFIIVAKSRQGIYFVTELAWALVNVGLTWICVRSFGLVGAGIAFFASYVFHALMIFPIVRRLSGFRWSLENRKAGLVFIASILIVFCGFQGLPPVVAASLGVSMLIVSAICSVRALIGLVPVVGMPRWIRPFIRDSALRSRSGL